MASKQGLSALELQRVTGLGSYQTAWTMLHKLRTAMASEGFVESEPDTAFLRELIELEAGLERYGPRVQMTAATGVGGPR